MNPNIKVLEVKYNRYRTTDGIDFGNLNEAEKHQYELDNPLNRTFSHGFNVVEKVYIASMGKVRPCVITKVEVRTNRYWDDDCDGYEVATRDVITVEDLSLPPEDENREHYFFGKRDIRLIKRTIEELVLEEWKPTT